MMISRSCGSKYNHKYDFPNRVSAIIKINNVRDFKLVGNIACDEDGVDFNDLSIREGVKKIDFF